MTPPRTTRRELVRSGLLAGGGLVLASACARPHRARAEHLVLISLDTLRADFLPCYGHTTIHAPGLARLAAESVVCTDAMTCSTTTWSSHASLWTGRYPHHHGVVRNGFLLPADAPPTMAEVLAGAGFATSAVIAAFPLDSRFGCDRGFVRYDQDFGLLDDGRPAAQRDAAAVTDAALADLRARDPERPLFLFVHYFDPHLPYEPPPEFRDLTADGPPLTEVQRRAAQGLGPGHLAKVAAYAAEISYLDHHLGRLIDGLRDLGVLERSLVAVTSDHGENLFDRRSRPFDHGRTVYDWEARSVALFRLPGGRNGGRRLTGPVSSIDVLPTVCTELGVAPPAGLDGQALDLHQLVPPPASRPRFAEASKPWRSDPPGPAWANSTKARCVRVGSLKYIRTAYRHSEELYDIERDPLEERNLLAGGIPGERDAATALAALLDGWQPTTPVTTSASPLTDADTTERLRALGYLDD